MIAYILILILCGELWRLGGDGQSLYRNPLVPLTIALGKVFLLGGNWWAILYALALYGAIQAFSYGLDSPIHNFWERVWHCGSNGNAPFVEMCTRSTCGLMWSLPAVVFAIVTGHWIGLGIYMIFLTVVCGLIWLIKNVEINERLVGICVACSIFI